VSESFPLERVELSPLSNIRALSGWKHQLLLTGEKANEDEEGTSLASNGNSD